MARQPPALPSPSLMRTAHGTAAEGGAVLVVEVPPIDELKPLNAADREAGLAIKKARGRPFQKRNRAAADRGPSLLRIRIRKEAPEDYRKICRKAVSLKNTRRAELEVMHRFERLPSSVEVEVKHWALAAAFTEYLYEKGEIAEASKLGERASSHQIKAIAFAEREAAAFAALDDESGDDLSRKRREFQRRLAEGNQQ